MAMDNAQLTAEGRARRQNRRAPAWLENDHTQVEAQGQESVQQAYAGVQADAEPGYHAGVALEHDWQEEAPARKRRATGPVCDLCNMPLEGQSSSALHLGGALAVPATGQWPPVHVHLECALWSPEVSLQGTRVVNVTQAVQRGRSMRCANCQQHGATIGCHHPGCQSTYHLPCACAAGCSLQEHGRVCLCPAHRPPQEEPPALVITHLQPQALMPPPPPRLAQPLGHLSVPEPAASPPPAAAAAAGTAGAAGHQAPAGSEVEEGLLSPSLEAALVLQQLHSEAGGSGWRSGLPKHGRSHGSHGEQLLVPALQPALMEAAPRAQAGGRGSRSSRGSRGGSSGMAALPPSGRQRQEDRDEVTVQPSQAARRQKPAAGRLGGQGPGWPLGDEEDEQEEQQQEQEQQRPQRQRKQQAAQRQQPAQPLEQERPVSLHLRMPGRQEAPGAAGTQQQQQQQQQQPIVSMALPSALVAQVLGPVVGASQLRWQPHAHELQLTPQQLQQLLIAAARSHVPCEGSAAVVPPNLQQQQQQTSLQMQQQGQQGQAMQQMQGGPSSQVSSWLPPATARPSATSLPLSSGLIAAGAPQSAHTPISGQPGGGAGSSGAQQASEQQQQEEAPERPAILVARARAKKAPLHSRPDPSAAHGP